MTASRDNVLLVHWHDLGRYLGVYGHPDVSSPRLDRLAAEGILFTRAHSTAPLCSPSRGSLFTGRYPQSNGLVGLAHHGWEYRAGVRTLPQILSESGWYSALFGMQHETSYPKRLGFDEFDVSNSYCEYVVDKAQEWLRVSTPDLSGQPFLLTAGFFETHRPYPPERYQPADSAAVELPDYLPDTPEVRQDLADFYGAIATADAAVGRTAGHARRDRTGRQHLGGVPHRSRSGVPAREVHALRRRNRHCTDRPPAHRPGVAAPGVYDDLFSGVDLVPTLLDLLGLDVPADVEGVSHAHTHACAGQANRSGARPRVHHEDLSRLVRPDSGNPHKGIQLHRELRARARCWTCRGISRQSPSGLAVAPFVKAPRPERELYDLRADPTETTQPAHQ